VGDAARFDALSPYGNTFVGGARVAVGDTDLSGSLYSSRLGMSHFCLEAFGVRPFAVRPPGVALHFTPGVRRPETRNSGRQTDVAGSTNVSIPAARSIVELIAAGPDADGVGKVTIRDDSVRAVGTSINAAAPTTAGGTISGTFIPGNPLSAFDGEDASGDWTLTIADQAGGDTGTLFNWSLKFTY